MRVALVFLSLLLAACSGSSSRTDGGFDGGDDGGGSEPGRPIFAFNVLTLEPPEPAPFRFVALTQPSDTVEVVAMTSGPPVRLCRVQVGSDVAEAVHELVEPPNTLNDVAPSAVRGDDGSLHVVWEADSGNIRYATDSSGSWSESTIGRGQAPSIALAADGTPYVAFFDFPDAVVARLEGDTWTTESIRDIGDARPWTAISGTNARLVVAGTVGDGNLWVRINEGGKWVEQSIDISDFIFSETTANYALAAGPAGIVLTFYSNPRQYAAFLPTGATGFEIRNLGAQFELVGSMEPILAGAGDEHAFIGSVDDGGQRLVVLAPGEPYWPLIASVPWETADCSRNIIALTLDADDQPIVAALCSGEVYVFRTVGAYPPEYDERCGEAVTALCDEACHCGGNGEACGFVSDDGDCSGNRSGCEFCAREFLCSNSTKSFDVLTSCLASFGEPSTCEPLGYPLSAECASLRKLEK